MNADRQRRRPTLHSDVAEHARVTAAGVPTSASVSLLDVPLQGVEDFTLSTEGGRLRVTAEVSARGLERRRRRDLIPAIGLTARDIDPKQVPQEIEGFIPNGVPTSFTPKRARPTHRLPPGRGKDVDRGGTIFDTDDRYLFDDLAFLVHHGQSTDRRRLGIRYDNRTAARADGESRPQLDRWG